MTKHWDIDSCRGCEYLRAHGIPENFIKEDHRTDLERQSITDAVEGYLERLADRKMEGC